MDPLYDILLDNEKRFIWIHGEASDLNRLVSIYTKLINDFEAENGFEANVLKEKLYVFVTDYGNELNLHKITSVCDTIPYAARVIVFSNGPFSLNEKWKRSFYVHAVFTSPNIHGIDSEQYEDYLPFGEYEKGSILDPSFDKNINRTQNGAPFVD
jgi:hypothetical protein